MKRLQKKIVVMGLSALLLLLAGSVHAAPMDAQGSMSGESPCLDEELTYFTPVEPTGAPYTILVNAASLDEQPLEAGDEIAVYDGDLCVGAIQVDEEVPYQLTAWEGDEELGLPGYTDGNWMIFYIWKASTNEFYRSYAAMNTGDFTFGFGSYSSLDLTAMNAFDPVDATGLPYTILIESLSIDGFPVEMGDQIGVMDGDLCVGVVTISGRWPLQLTAWEGDPALGLQGFVPGNPIEFLVVLNVAGEFFEPTPTFIQGNGDFGAGIYSQVTLFSSGINLPPSSFDLISPENEATLDEEHCTFLWHSTNDPDPEDHIVYQLQLSSSEDFSSEQTQRIDTGEDTTCVVDGLEDDTNYWWRVKAIDTNTAGTLSINTNTLQTNIPDPPPDFSMITCSMLQAEHPDSVEVVVMWQRSLDPDPDATESYDLYVDRDIEMGSPLLLASGIDGPGGTVPNVVWTETVALSDLPDEGVSFFYFMAQALDNNTWGTWASNVVGCLYADAGESQTVGLPSEFEIAKVYPNPFNASFTATIGIPEPAFVKLSLYNVTGQKAAEILAGEQAPGYHNITFNSGTMTSGVYFLKLESASQTQTHKLILLK